MNRLFYSIFFIMAAIQVAGQSGWNGRQLVLQNNQISRIIVFEEGKFNTLSYRLKDYPFNFVSIMGEEPRLSDEWDKGTADWYRGADPEEFAFLANDQKINGSTGWNVLRVDEFSETDFNRYAVHLAGTSHLNRDLELVITYIIYSDIPIIRKKIDIRNKGKTDLKIESLDVESLTVPWGNIHNVIYHNYARNKHLGPYLGEWHDPLIISYDRENYHGIILGNEAPGVMKRTSVCLDGRIINAGLTHVDQNFAFRKWIKPGEVWNSTWIFTGLYAGHEPFDFVEGPVNDFVRNYMGIRLVQLEEKPAFVYNTWQPFRRDVHEHLIKELADEAAACGVEEFIIDDGWQVGFGDWEIDYEKFPNGLKPVFDYIKSKGMKPGLWLSMGAASKDCKVFREHPEWFVRDKNGDFVNLHSEWEKDRVSACFTTGWKDYIKGKILNLVKEHGLEYVKLDFAIATSAYRFDPDISGCFAEDHPHTDRQESYLEIYRSAWQLYDELHELAPGLFIDCTFETMGALQMIDYDMCKHADGNWLSNFEGTAPFGSARIRNMSWWRSPVMPATALVIGNQSLDDEYALYSFKSLCGSLPIMLGDPRKMNDEKQQQFKQLSSWFRAMEEKHGIMLYRQDLQGFGEPKHGSWDGFQRINTDTQSGGIIGVFKQYSPVDEQWVVVSNLDPGKIYEVKHSSGQQVVKSVTGKELGESGFKVTFQDDFQGELFEVGVVRE